MIETKFLNDSCLQMRDKRTLKNGGVVDAASVANVTRPSDTVGLESTAHAVPPSQHPQNYYTFTFKLHFTSSKSLHVNTHPQNYYMFTFKYSDLLHAYLNLTNEAVDVASVANVTRPSDTVGLESTAHAVHPTPYTLHLAFAL